MNSLVTASKTVATLNSISSTVERDSGTVLPGVFTLHLAALLELT
jgi:hypothetical protein